MISSQLGQEIPVFDEIIEPDESRFQGVRFEAGQPGENRKAGRC